MRASIQTDTTMDQARVKLETEMDGNKANTYIQVVGRFLLQHIASHPADAGKIMAADKTIAKSLDAMKKKAAKTKVDNCAVLTDQEGFANVAKYFGLNTEAVPRKEPKALRKDVDFDVRLDDLL